MAEAEAAPRKRLLIKLYLRRSEKCDPPPSEAPDDSRGQKRRQNQCNSTDDEHSEVGESDAKRSRTVSHEESKPKDDADSHAATMRKVATTEVSAMARGKTQPNIAHPRRPFVQENPGSGSRISRTGSEECGLKKMDVKRKKEEIPKARRRMDRIKRMQCWVILKRFMVGRDGWAFKRPLDLKGLEVLGNSDKSTISKPMDLKNAKAIGFEEIESKLKNLMYAGPDEFAHDMRLVFSRALLCPPRNEIHRIGRRLSESFELSWKTLKDKWSKEERRENKILKGDRVFPEVDDRRAAKEAHERKVQKGNKGSRGGSKDSQRCVADKS